MMTGNISVCTRLVKRFIRSNSIFLNSKEKTWCIRFLEYSASMNSVDLLAYATHIAELNLVAFKAEIRFIVKIVRESGIEVNPFALRFLLSLEKEKPRPSIFLPKTKHMVEVFSKLSVKAKLVFILLSVTGRRQIDIKRIQSKDVKFARQKIFFKVSKSKTSNLPLHFFADLSERDEFLDSIDFGLVSHLKKVQSRFIYLYSL